MMRELRECIEALENRSSPIDREKCAGLLLEVVDRLERSAAALDVASGRDFYLNIEGTATHGDVLLMDQALREVSYLLLHGACSNYENLFGLESQFMCPYDDNGNYRTDVALRSDGSTESYATVTEKLFPK